MPQAARAAANLAELAGAVATGPKCALGLVPELYVFREKGVFGVLGHRGLLLFSNSSIMYGALFLFCLLFVWRFLALPADKLLRTGVMLALLIMPIYPLIERSWLTVLQAHILEFLLVLGITLIMFLRLVRSAREGNYEARLLLIPFLLMLGAEDANQVG